MRCILTLYFCTTSRFSYLNVLRWRDETIQNTTQILDNPIVCEHFRKTTTFCRNFTPYVISFLRLHCFLPSLGQHDKDSQRDETISTSVVLSHTFTIPMLTLLLTKDTVKLRIRHIREDVVMLMNRTKLFQSFAGRYIHITSLTVSAILSVV